MGANESGLTKTQIIQQLTRSPHGDLTGYVATTLAAATQDPEFMAHLIAWNHENGQIRDAKVALPVITLGVRDFVDELRENSLAHLARLDPRNFVRALTFARQTKVPGHYRTFGDLVIRYVRHLEANGKRWERAAMQHRKSLKTLYAIYHIKPCLRAQRVLFEGKYISGDAFDSLARLGQMAPQDAAEAIVKHKIPYLVAVGAMGQRMKNADVLLAIMERMSANELATNMKMLEKFGVRNDPALRAKLEEKLGKLGKSKTLTLKTTKAVEAVADDGLREKLRAAQAKQIKSQGVDGNWLVLGDASGSMHEAIKVASELAGALTSFVKGKVHLIFFDTAPRYMDVTGLDHDAVLEKTKHVRAGGATSIGCGLQYCVDRAIDIDGVAVVSDGGENNRPTFAQAHAAYTKAFGKQLPVYWYKLGAHTNDLWGRGVERECEAAVEEFDLTGGFDYYSLPNIAKTMRSQRYSLVDDIMQVPLIKLADVFK